MVVRCLYLLVSHLLAFFSTQFTSICGQNILPTVDEANVKKEHFDERGDQEKCFRGRGTRKRIWMRLDGMLAQRKTKALGNLSPCSSSSRVCSCLVSGVILGITVG